MAKYLITGGSGLVGMALARHLVGFGQEVTILSRKPGSAMKGGLRFRHWDPAKLQIDEEAIREADHIVHLAGANVAEKRWTDSRKKEIIESRVQSGRFLADCLRTIPNRVSSVLGASAQGWYGPDPDTPGFLSFKESDPAHHDFLGSTCRLWEESLQDISSLGIRLIQLRIGIVLSTQGGALAEFRKPVRFGFSPILGSGSQVISWIHIQDLVSMIQWALTKRDVSGVYNAAAPAPVTNRDLMRALAKASRVPFIPIPVPTWALRWMLGEMSVEVLKSTTLSGEKVRQAGFVFSFCRIQDALRDLIP